MDGFSSGSGLKATPIALSLFLSFSLSVFLSFSLSLFLSFGLYILYRAAPGRLCVSLLLLLAWPWRAGGSAGSEGSEGQGR